MDGLWYQPAEYVAWWKTAIAIAIVVVSLTSTVLMSLWAVWRGYSCFFFLNTFHPPQKQEVISARKKAAHISKEEAAFACFTLWKKTGWYKRRLALTGLDGKELLKEMPPLRKPHEYPKAMEIVNAARREGAEVMTLIILEARVQKIEEEERSRELKKLGFNIVPRRGILNW